MPDLQCWEDKLSNEIEDLREVLTAHDSSQEEVDQRFGAARQTMRRFRKQIAKLDNSNGCKREWMERLSFLEEELAALQEVSLDLLITAAATPQEPNRRGSAGTTLEKTKELRPTLRRTSSRIAPRPALRRAEAKLETSRIK